MRGYDVVIEQDERCWFAGSVPALPGCHTQGRTIEQWVERMDGAIALHLDDLNAAI